MSFTENSQFLEFPLINCCSQYLCYCIYFEEVVSFAYSFKDLNHLYKFIYKVVFFWFIFIGMFRSCYCRITSFWSCFFLCVAEYILSLLSTYLFLQSEQVEAGFQGGTFSSNWCSWWLPPLIVPSSVERGGPFSDHSFRYLCVQGTNGHSSWF